MPLLFVFLIVPLIEIALFVTVGGAIGLLGTLVIVIVTALFGSTLLRSQGLATLFQLKTAVITMDDVTQPALHGVLLFAAGLLMLTPGFFTDAVGLALLIPNVRQALIQWGIDAIAAKVVVQPWFPQGASSDDIIDGVAHTVKPQDEPEHSPKIKK